MARPSFETLYQDLARGMSRRSTCRRLAVGAVITSVDHRYVLGVGYNGNAAGLPNDCDADIPGACGCVHAEANAVINCRADRRDSKYVYVTHQPCKACAKMIVNLGGVVRVEYVEPYRLLDGLEVLHAARISVRQMDPLVASPEVSSAPPSPCGEHDCG